MRILFVHPATDMSIGDVARGYRAALERQGHEMADYSLKNRFAYHIKGIPQEHHSNENLVSKTASENIVVEALYHQADWVVIVSGLNLHPVSVWLLGQVRIPVAVILTESPYDDENQATWLDFSKANIGRHPDITVFTNDRYSADQRGWHFLAPAFNPTVHRVTPPNDEYACDVMMVGTGWPERQRFLEAVDWTGINLRLYGIWMNVDEQSPLYQFYRPRVINNDYIAEMYNSAKICINFHRASNVALTPGPRCYELAACGAFQLSDPRPDLASLFGDSVPTFDSPESLGILIRYYLEHEAERKKLALDSWHRVRSETFDHRAAQMMAVLQPQPEGVV